MWDCTLTSPNLDDSITVGVDESKLKVSIPMTPKAKGAPHVNRKKGDPHWERFGCACTPQELRDNPLGEVSPQRAFTVVAGKLLCTECNDGVARTTRGHDAHYRGTHEGLDVYGSFTNRQTASGGRVNPNVPEGRDSHRAALLKELRKLGVTARNLAAEGYELSELDRAGFTFKDLHAIGSHTLEEMCAAGVTRQLKATGISLQQLSAAGYSIPILRKAGFSCAALKADGASLADLRAAGFPLAELRDGGFTLAEFKELRRPNSNDPAFTVQDLMKEGYNCRALRNAGYTLNALKSGYSEADLKVTHFTTKAELAEDGFPLRELKIAGFPAHELLHAGFSKKALLEVGFSKGALVGS